MYIKEERAVDEEIYHDLIYSPEKGLKALMKAYTGLVYTIVAGKLGTMSSPEEIEEGVSDVFLEVFEARDRIDISKSSLKGFIAMVAARRGIDRYRKLKAERTHLTPMEEGAGLESLPAENETEGYSREEKWLLVDAVKALGKPDSDLFIRRYYLGQTSREIAAALKMRVSAVDKRLSRGIEKIKSLLGEGK